MRTNINNPDYHGISKDEAVKKLNEMGIPAIYDKGVIHIPITDEDFEEGCRKMDKILEKIDYRMSHGYKHESTINNKNIGEETFIEKEYIEEKEIEEIE